MSAKRLAIVDHDSVYPPAPSEAPAADCSATLYLSLPTDMLVFLPAIYPTDIRELDPRPL